MLSDCQFGFLSKKSTNLQLLQYLEYISSNIAKGLQVDSIYLDFAKAFDSVSHPKLLHKLNHYGVRGDLLTWLESFLSDRRQCVRVGSTLSSWIPVVSGVPQGSVLGPVLFLFFINDLPLVCGNTNCVVFMFADDVKCSSVIRSLADCVNLQSAIESINRWSFAWQLPLSLEKSKVISFCLNGTSLEFLYNISSTVLTRVDLINDLGILFSSNLSFSEHIKNICSTARTRAAVIMKCFSSRDRNVLFMAFTVFVRPTLEYCSTIWNPFRLCDIKRIESVQRRFTKRLYGLHNLSYADRLRVLNSESLQSRRIKSDLKLYFAIINNLTSISSTDFFTIKHSVTRSGGTGHSLIMPRFHSNMERYLFKNRCINVWNVLPVSIINSSSLQCFKSRLNSTIIEDFVRIANRYST